MSMPDEKLELLDEDDLDQVVGGANPFQNKKRVPDNDYDEKTKENA